MALSGGALSGGRHGCLSSRLNFDYPQAGVFMERLEKKPAMLYALRLVARAEQFSAGLSLKLQKKGYSKADIKAVAGALAETGMLDDKRYSRLWIESRIKHRADSPRELLSSLRRKGIDRRAATAALEEVFAGSDESSAGVELSLLRRFITKSGLDGGDSCGNLREKLRFEGFSAEVLEYLYDE
ncbi:MAG: recombination regulator RecX [Treponema sp.]|jgi:regulatory protein|nr:recombination regulator RecX [Treponema sp.]